MATRIDLESYLNLKKFHCDKGKHRFRDNKFGITWCVICGLLSNSTASYPLVKEEEKLIIYNK